MENLKKIIISIIAINFIALGGTLFLQAKLGSDSITLLLEGLHVGFGLSYGLVGILYNGVFIIISLLLNRKVLGVGTFIYALTCGYFVDFYTYIISNTINVSGIVVSVPMILIGQLSICMGFALLISMNIGMSGLDGVLYYLEEKFDIRYKISKTVVDIIFCLSGMLLGGVFGIGSIFAMITGGTIISYLQCKMNKKTQFV